MVCSPRWVLLGALISCILAAIVDAFEDKHPQPIGIDFSPEMITVAYAHTMDNVSLLARVRPAPDDPYATHMFQLRQEFRHDKNVTAFWNTSPDPGSGTAQMVLAHLASALFPIGDFARRSWIGQRARGLWDDILTRAFPVQASAASSLDEITLDDVKNAFLTVLTTLKEQAQSVHGVEMRSAIFAIPEFFNQTLADLLIEAAEEIGIAALDIPLRRTVMSTYSRDIPAKRPRDQRYLVMDLGEHHLDLCIAPSDPAQLIGGSYLPMDPWEAATLTHQMTARVIDQSEALQNWIAMGGNKLDLYLQILRARFLIKDNIDAELMGIGEAEDHHYEEYPLHVKDPNSDHAGIDAVLTWDDVQGVEARYIDSLAHNIRIALVQSNPDFIRFLDDTTPTTIDKVFILTGGFDGRVVKRAIQQVLPGVEVVGGAMRDLGLAAEGTAQIAFVYHWTSVLRSQRAQQKDEL